MLVPSCLVLATEFSVRLGGHSEMYIIAVPLHNIDKDNLITDGVPSILILGIYLPF